MRFRGNVRARRADDNPRLGQLQSGRASQGRYHIFADTMALMQRFEGTCSLHSLRFIIPYRGGIVSHHSGRYRGLVDMLMRPDLSAHVMNNVLFDNCVYHRSKFNLLVG